MGTKISLVPTTAHLTPTARTFTLPVTTARQTAHLVTNARTTASPVMTARLAMAAQAFLNTRIPVQPRGRNRTLTPTNRALMTREEIILMKS